MTSHHDDHHRPRLPAIPDLRFEYSYLRSIHRHIDGPDPKWGQIAWVTLRDQILAPMLQGTIWAIAGIYLSPYAAKATALLPKQGEGSGSQRLRKWAGRLGRGIWSVGVAPGPAAAVR